MSTHLDLFQTGPEPLKAHGDIVRNPRNFGLIMEGVFKECKDWQGLGARIALQRGLKLYEDKMEAMDYDPEKPGYDAVYEKYEQADRAQRAIDHLSPLKGLQ